jgi:hypothetical protein
VKRGIYHRRSLTEVGCRRLRVTKPCLDMAAALDEIVDPAWRKGSIEIYCNRGVLELEKVVCCEAG